MNKLSDYRSRIFEVIADYERATFQYGVKDCALFGADIVNAITGVDPAVEYRGKYRSLKGGLKAIRKIGFKDQADYLAKIFEAIETPFAQFGDLAVIETNDESATGFSIGLVGGSFVIALSHNGLVRLPLSSIKNVYRVA